MKFINRIFGSSSSSQAYEDQTEAILNRHLDCDFRVFPMADTRTTLAQVTAIADRCRIKYPPEFCGHVCGKFPGIFVEVKEEIWPRPKALAVGPFWSFLYALHTFTSSPDSEPWMRLDHVAELLQKRTGLAIAPVLKLVGATTYCANAIGDLVRFDHETDEIEDIRIDFWELFEREVAALCHRKTKKKNGEK